jgi:DNA-binding PadR family transcriptional regulator
MKESPLKVEFKGFLTFLILHEIKQKNCTGEDLAKKIGQRKGAQLTPGTIYPTLKRLRRLRLMTYKRYGRRKVYSLTPEGEEELQKSYGLIGIYLKGVLPLLKAKQKQPETPKKQQKKKKKVIVQVEKKMPKKGVKTPQVKTAENNTQPLSTA